MVRPRARRLGRSWELPVRLENIPRAARVSAAPPKNHADPGREPRPSDTVRAPRDVLAYSRPVRFFASCAEGTEDSLRRELAALRLKGVRGERGGVAFEGDLEAGLRACLHTRVAMRVLVPLASFPAPDAAQLYDGARTVDWKSWLSTKTTLAVEATVRDSAITHSGFAALKVKDAVVDALRDALGARPDVRIVLHLARDEADLALDLAGEPLHRRGYRAAMTPSPLKETLADAVLALGGVDPGRPFVD